MSLLYLTGPPGLEPVELASLFNEAETRTYPGGAVIFTPEDPCSERLFFLEKGRVELYRLSVSGKRLVTRQIQPGSVFGVMGLLGRTMQGNFAVATEDSNISMVSREHVMTLLRRQPDLALRILEVLGNRLCILEERLVEATYSSVAVRLAHFLLNNADPTSGVISKATHEEIGDAIGAVRQTVSENLSIMKKHGLVLTGPRRIQLLDRRELEEIVRNSEGTVGSK